MAALIPHKGFVLVERDEAPKQSKGGIFLPEASQQKGRNPPGTGTVKAIGDNDPADLKFAVGTRVVFRVGLRASEEPVPGEKNLILLPLDDVLGRWE